LPQLEVYIDTLEHDWPARELLCRDLGVPHSRIKGRTTAFQLKKVVLSYLARRPFGLLRLLSVLDDYWDCKVQINYITKEALSYDNDRNRGMIEHIMEQACQSLLREPPAHWPELMGLYCQKLAHLRYYDEFAGKEPPSGEKVSSF